MEPSQLKPGDTVIPLAVLCITAAIVCGAINSAVVTWNFNHTWWLAIVSFFVGSILSWGIAKIATSFVYPAPPSDVCVVKAGASALPKTIVAAIIGSVIGLFICGIGYAFFIGGSTLVKSVGIPLIIVSVTISFLWGVFSALV